MKRSDYESTDDFVFDVIGNGSASTEQLAHDCKLSKSTVGRSLRRMIDRNKVRRWTLWLAHHSHTYMYCKV